MDFYQGKTNLHRKKVATVTFTWVKFPSDFISSGEKQASRWDFLSAEGIAK